MMGVLTFLCSGIIIKNMFDYHVHTHYSMDSEASLARQLDAAVKAGLSELCLTDHVDFDEVTAGVPLYPPADLKTLRLELEALKKSYPALTIKRGAEIGLCDTACADAAYEHIKDLELDYVIGSLHVLEGENVYFPSYFEGKARDERYIAYLEGLNRAIRTNAYFCAMGHYDFIAKNAPFPMRAMRLSLCPGLFDEIFTYLIRNGKTLEVNASAWKDDASWGLDILKRFRALGGEFVTVGSDAHRPAQVGRRLEEARALVREAGIPYVATYEKMKPVLHRA